MKDFLLTIVLEGLEEKYSLRLCRGSFSASFLFIFCYF